MLKYLPRACAMVALVISGVVMGEPFHPSNSATVLERLPYKPADPQARELRELRAQLAVRPDNLPIALQLARRYYELVNAEGDPRYIGYAQAALKPWWTAPSPPPEVGILRASLKQYRHDFDNALADLTTALAQDPGNAQAWSLAANIHMVQGRYAQARSECQSLQKVAARLIGMGCFAMLDALQGKARQAHDVLEAALLEASDASPAQRLWVLTRLGEMAVRFGDYALAERHFSNGLALNISDGYLLAAYADLLLDRNRPREVLNLLKGMNRSDLLLLRIALADKALAAPDAERRRAELASRFEAEQMRGDKVHQAEEARFRLHLVADPKTALQLAKENWAVQKETRDARILLESAIAAKNPEAAEPVSSWLRETGMEDLVLRKLAQQLGNL